jgi:hypothetical protein
MCYISSFNSYVSINFNPLLTFDYNCLKWNERVATTWSPNSHVKCYYFEIFDFVKL